MEEIKTIDKKLEQRLKEDFGSQITLEMMNLLRVGKAAYEHAFGEFIPKEKFMEFVSSAYDAGVDQVKIYGLEREGLLNNNGSDVINFADFLISEGVAKKYVSR